MSTFSRAAWGGGDVAPGRELAGPLHRVFIHHTTGRTPTSVEDAAAEVRATWVGHTSPSSSDPTKPWPDIGYSWLVDDLGNAYEGLGWLQRGIHTYGYNSVSHGICWMGNAMVRRPSSSAIAAIAQVILDGQRVGAIGPTPTIEGHRDVLATACPGDLLYDALPMIRRAVLGGDLGPATTPPTSGEEDEVLTPEQATQLREVHFWLGQGYVAGGTVAAMRPDIDALARRLDNIEKRLGALEAGEVPTADEVVLAAARRITEAAR